MRWYPKPKTKPAFADTRWVVRFAFLPKKLDCGTIVWMERYWQNQVFVNYWTDIKAEWYEGGRTKLYEQHTKGEH